MNHPSVWLIWALAAAIPALLIRNPLYLAIIGLAAWLVFVSASQDSGLEQNWKGLIKLGMFVWLLTIPFNALMIHQGSHILFRLPQSWPLVGGNITLEAMLYGVVSGLALWVLLLIFAALNAAIDTSQLLRLTPSFLYQAGVVTSIALTFVPQMLLSAKEIREAQQIRGHRFRSWRDLLPLFVPLLTTGFERAVLLAESMESRGFGGQLTTMTTGEANRTRLNMVLGLLLLLCGLFLYGYLRRMPGVGMALLALAALFLLRTFGSIGRRVQRSHYRRLRWSGEDTFVTLLSLSVACLTWLIRARDGLALAYYPYPPYPMLPEFNVGIGLILALLTVPGIMALSRTPDFETTAPVPPSMEELS
jgi:energy-coupling factor transport system permease protein